MTPAARIAAAIEILDTILAGKPAEQALLGWSRARRFAGSGDRAAIRDHVFDVLRQRGSLSSDLSVPTGRDLMIALLRRDDIDPAVLFTGQGHAPTVLTPGEQDWLSRPVPPNDPLDDVPQWCRAAWQASLGEDALSAARAVQTRAPVWLRANLLQATPDAAVAALQTDGVSATPSVHLPTALRVTAGERRVSQAAAYRDGLVELQDLSPQSACALLPVADGATVLDFCAGGGGKSLAVAAMAHGVRVTAHDVDPARMTDLPQRADRAGAPVTPVNSVRGRFDLVVADVPCSGSGTWRRTPDAKWRLTPEAVEKLCASQRHILLQTADHVVPGGYLAYMTCSVFEAENDAQIDAFLARRNDFRRVSRHCWAPARDGGDGFYLALLQRL